MARFSTSGSETSNGMDRATFLIAGVVFVCVFVGAIALGNLGTSSTAPQAFAQSVPTTAPAVIETRETSEPSPVTVRPKPVGRPPRNCTEARRRGIAPMYEGDPNYGEWMDGDGDGIACEPYHGR